MVCSAGVLRFRQHQQTCQQQLTARRTSLQEYERVHRLTLEWQWSRGNRACSFDVCASPTQLVDALQVTNINTLAQLPLLASDIGRQDVKHKQHTRLVAHLAVALVLTKEDCIDLNFGLPEHQASPRYSSQHTKLINMQLRRQLDAWLAALVEAAGSTLAKRIVCSSYVLQAVARHELSQVLGHRRLAFQRTPFQQAPQVDLYVNTDTCALTSGLVWRALRNIQCLQLQFEVSRGQQLDLLQKVPSGSIRCLTVSGCDIHAPGMLKALCGTLRRVEELECFQLGAASQWLSGEDECPLSDRQLGTLSRSLLRPYRIVSVEFFNKSLQDEMMNMMPWCLSRFTADQITKAVAEEAYEADCDSMQNASTLDEAMPFLKGVVNSSFNLSSSNCSQPLAPTIAKLLPPQVPPAA